MNAVPRPATNLAVRRFLACLLAPALAACVAHDPATSQSEGEAHVTSTAPGGTVERFDIATPDGDVYVKLLDLGTSCELSVHATTPVASDLTSAAEAKRVTLDVTAKTTELPDLLAGKAQSLTAHAGVLAADCTVRLERNHGSAEVYDQWCSTGGTVTIDALPAEGGKFHLKLEAITAVPTGASETQEDRVLAGTVDATYLGTVVAGGVTGSACPK